MNLTIHPLTAHRMADLDAIFLARGCSAAKTCHCMDDRRGIAGELFAAALPFARKHGTRLLEAYPVDRAVTGSPDSPWFGSLSLFRPAGFDDVACHRKARPIVRVALNR